MVGEELATSFTDTPVFVRGMGQASGRALHAADDLTALEATRFAAHEAYGMAGLSAGDIQFAEVHDCFSIAEILAVEDLGFFAPGTGYKAIEEGLTRLDGTKPDQSLGRTQVQRASGRSHGRCAAR